MATRKAMEGWVRENHVGVYRAAWRVLQNVDDARDVTQEVFLDAFRNPERVEAADDVGRVLRWRAAKAALMRRRSESARRRREVSPAVRSIGEPSAAPDAPAALNEELAALTRGLRRLPDDLRLAVSLRFQDGLTFGQIGDAMECSSTHAHERVRRGLDGLRRFLTGAGLTLWAADARAVERGLESLDASAPPELPPGLAETLVASAPATISVGGTFLVAALFLGSAIGLAKLGGSSGASDASSLFDAAHSPTRVATAAAGGGAETSEVERAAAAPAEVPAAPTAMAPMADDVAIPGRVIDADGRPIAGFAVEARSLDNTSKGRVVYGDRTTTGLDGSFTLSVHAPPLAGERWSVLASYGPITMTAESVLVHADRQTPPVEIRITEGLDETPGTWTLELTVRTREGEPVTDTRVALHRRPGQESQWVFPDPEAIARTNAYGTARLTGKMLGTKELRVRSTSLPIPTFTTDVEVRTPFANRDLVIFDPRDVAGTVTDEEGHPILGATVGTRGVTTTTDANGRFRIDDVGPAFLILESSAPGRAAAVLSQVATGADDVVIVLNDEAKRNGVLAGRVIDAHTGATLPIPYDSEIYSMKIPDSMPLDAVRGDLLPNHTTLFQAQQIDNGEMPAPKESFSLTGLDPTRVVLCVRIGAYAPAFLGPYDLGKRPVVDDILARLKPAARIEGTIVDPNGSPLANAYVVVTGNGPTSEKTMAQRDAEALGLGGRGQYLYSMHGRTDENGHFSIHGLPDDLPLRLAAFHTGYQPGRTGLIALTAGKTTAGVEVRLGKARERK